MCLVHHDGINLLLVVILNGHKHRSAVTHFDHYTIRIAEAHLVAAGTRGFILACTTDEK